METIVNGNNNNLNVLSELFVIKYLSIIKNVPRPFMTHPQSMGI